MELEKKNKEKNKKGSRLSQSEGGHHRPCIWKFNDILFLTSSYTKSGDQKSPSLSDLPIDIGAA